MIPSHMLSSSSAGPSPQDQYNELVGILKEMPIPTVRRDLRKNRNVRWLRRHIKPDWKNAERALELLALCDETQAGKFSPTPVWAEIVRESYAKEDEFRKRYAEKGLEVGCNNW